MLMLVGECATGGNAMKRTLSILLVLAVMLAMLLAVGGGFPWSELPAMP
jgi:hypothetical protein